MKLYIGNKNYSSWSMRPWVLMKQAGIAFDEVMVRFDSFDADSTFKRELQRVSPTGKVPVLVDGDLVVWDTLAIAEYLAERFPEKALWPADARARARARSVCAEMHAGFSAMRSHLTMNIEASLPAIGEKVLKEQPAVRADIARIVALWTGLLEAHGGPLLFGGFSIADAFFAPVVTRLRTYAVPVPPVITAYMDRVVALPGVAAWIADALQERDFRAFEEPYRTTAA
ncbi:MAG TPA: glutathione S-transferase family protein [Burkholderiaceae bacterium]|nr:glutathione S-transferase family protein [Burkholderiaceae bacterium]